MSTPPKWRSRSRPRTRAPWFLYPLIALDARFIESWEVLVRFCRFALRRTNMSPLWAFVKRVNTTYCAFVLGQSQDVDVLKAVRVSGKRQIGALFRAVAEVKRKKLKGKKKNSDSRK